MRPALHSVSVKPYALKEASGVKYLSPKEYALLVGVDPRTVYNWLRANPHRHNAEKIEGVWRITCKA